MTSHPSHQLTQFAHVQKQRTSRTPKKTNHSSSSTATCVWHAAVMNFYILSACKQASVLWCVSIRKVIYSAFGNMKKNHKRSITFQLRPWTVWLTTDVMWLVAPLLLLLVQPGKTQSLGHDRRIWGKWAQTLRCRLHERYTPDLWDE